MRVLFLSMLFFFGPGLLLLMLRGLFRLYRYRLLQQRMHHAGEVIDISPHHPLAPPSRWFIALAVGLGLFAALWAWRNFSAEPNTDSVYRPAYLDAYGEVVPGEVMPKER